MRAPSGSDPLRWASFPVLRTPICQWNNQNWRIERDTLLIPVSHNGQVGQIAVRCSTVEPLGKPGVLRIKRQRGK